MKKRVIPVFLLCLILLLWGCSEKGEQTVPEETTPAGITVSFDTTIAGYTIASVFLDGSPKYMPDTPFYVGRTFLGWYYDAEYTRPFLVTDPLTEDTTLYAKWRINVDTTEFDETEGKEQNVGGIVFTKVNDAYYVVSGYAGIHPDVTLPDRFNDLPVTAIAAGAFDDTLVTSVLLSASITEVEGGAFSGANKLTSITVAASSPFYRSYDGVLYSKDGKTLVCLPVSGPSGTYAVREETESIAPYALYGSDADLTFASDCKITQIGEYAFAGFSGSVTLPKEVVFIQKHAFSGADCVVHFASDCRLTAFGNGEFDGYIGAEIVLPSSITSLSGAPFADCIAAVDLSQTGLTELGGNAFYGYAGIKLEIPASVVSLSSGCFYKCAAQIIFDERSALQTVGEKSFSNFAGKVTFPATVRKIEKYAFYNAQQGAEISFSTKQSEIAIDEKAFYASHATVQYK